MIFTFVLLSIISSAFADFTKSTRPFMYAEGPNGTSRLQVQIPQRLFKTAGYDHRAALFGIPPHGGSMAQNVYYADSDLCNPIVDKSKGYPIRAKDKNGKMQPWPSPYILMVDRGNCSFVQKVRNAQQSGAAGVVIADNTCLCSDSMCISDSDVCETAEPFLADDGSGQDISIPSFLMFKKDADAVKAELRSNHQVKIEMQWALPSPDGRVVYDLWTTPSDMMSHTFIKKFKTVAQALGNHAYFTPHMYISDGIMSHCENENMCFNLCTNSGRYCATSTWTSDGRISKSSGADIVKESLRRICIWKHYGERNGIGTEWWDYIAEFLHRCDTTDYFANQDCINDVYKHSGIDGNLVDRCMSDSGGFEGDVPNSFLDAEMAAQFRRGIVILPTASVDTFKVRDAITVQTMFSAICARYAEGLEPNICKKCAKCPDALDCIQRNGECDWKCDGSGVAGGEGEDSMSMRTFTIILFAVGATFAGLVALHWKTIRNHTRQKSRNILTNCIDSGPGDNTVGGSSPLRAYTAVVVD